jgi:hypothetical protein
MHEYSLVIKTIEGPSQYDFAMDAFHAHFHANMDLIERDDDTKPRAMAVETLKLNEREFRVDIVSLVDLTMPLNEWFVEDGIHAPYPAGSLLLWSDHTSEHRHEMLWTLAQGNPSAKHVIEHGAVVSTLS